MKTTLALIVCLLLTLTACTNQSMLNVPDIETQKSSTEASVNDPTEAITMKIEDSIESGMKRIGYSYDAVVSNFDFSQEERIDPISLTIDIPEYFVNAADIENCKIYGRYDKENVYVRGFEIGWLYGVSSEFVMDDSIHKKTNCGGTWDPLTEFSVSTGKTTSGYDYVLYEIKNDVDYLAYAYIRISDEYIMGLNYWDLNENRHFLISSIESVRI